MKPIQLLILLCLLGACSENNTGVQEELLYRARDRLCLTTSGSHQTVTLLDDVTTEQHTVPAEMPDGSVRMIDVAYLSDQRFCLDSDPMISMHHINIINR